MGFVPGIYNTWYMFINNMNWDKYEILTLYLCLFFGTTEDSVGGGVSSLHVGKIKFQYEEWYIEDKFQKAMNKLTEMKRAKLDFFFCYYKQHNFEISKSDSMRAMYFHNLLNV